MRPSACEMGMWFTSLRERGEQRAGLAALGPGGFMAVIDAS